MTDEEAASLLSSLDLNKYGCPPSQIALSNARAFLRSLESNLRPCRVRPSTVGGLEITFRVKTKKVVVEFHDGTVYSIFYCHSPVVRRELIAWRSKTPWVKLIQRIETALM